MLFQPKKKCSLSVDRFTLILYFPVGESECGVSFPQQGVPDIFFISQNVLDAANLPDGGVLLGGDAQRRDLLCDILHADA